VASIGAGPPTFAPSLPGVPSHVGFEAAGPHTENCTVPVTGPRLPLSVATSVTEPSGSTSADVLACVVSDGGGWVQVSVLVAVKLPVLGTPGGDHDALATTVCVPAGTTIGTTFVADEALNEKLPGLPGMSTPSIVVLIVTVLVFFAGNAANEYVTSVHVTVALPWCANAVGVSTNAAANAASAVATPSSQLLPPCMRFDSPCRVWSWPQDAPRAAARETAVEAGPETHRMTRSGDGNHSFQGSRIPEVGEGEARAEWDVTASSR
jgi:hypothetical protein